MSQSSQNYNIRLHCIFSNAKLKNTKVHSKEGTFQTMLNQKHYDAQHQLGKMLHDETLSPWLKN